jgi:hypothetical protein
MERKGIWAGLVMFVLVVFVIGYKHHSVQLWRSGQLAATHADPTSTTQNANQPQAVLASMHS